jgi:effector-binding domain-containing protein
VIDPPVLEQSAGQDTAVIHLTIPREAMRTTMAPAHAELMAAVAAQGVEVAGCWFTHHLRMDPHTFDFEIGVPVSAPVTPAGRVMASSMPLGMVARTTYRGGYEGLRAAWSEFDAWLLAEGQMARPDIWECYVVGPESSPDSSLWCTELSRALAP